MTSQARTDLVTNVCTTQKVWFRVTSLSQRAAVNLTTSATLSKCFLLANTNTVSLHYNTNQRMGDLGAQLNQLTPEQKQAVLVQAQQEANQQVMTGKHGWVGVLRVILGPPNLTLVESHTRYTTEMMKRMVAACYDKCTGTSVGRPMSGLGSCAVEIIMGTLQSKTDSFFSVRQGDKLDSREQSCMAMCQDRYLETRAQVQETLMKRQGNDM